MTETTLIELLDEAWAILGPDRPALPLLLWRLRRRRIEDAAVRREMDIILRTTMELPADLAAFTAD